MGELEAPSPYFEMTVHEATRPNHLVPTDNILEDDLVQKVLDATDEGLMTDGGLVEGHVSANEMDVLELRRLAKRMTPQEAKKITRATIKEDILRIQMEYGSESLVPFTIRQRLDHLKAAVAEREQQSEAESAGEDPGESTLGSYQS